MPLLVTGQPVSVVPPPPLPPPQVQAQPQLFRNPFKMNSEILIVAKAALKVVPIVEKAAPVVAALAHATNVDDVDEHSYALANPPSPAMEVSVDAGSAGGFCGC